MRSCVLILLLGCGASPRETSEPVPVAPVVIARTAPPRPVLRPPIDRDRDGDGVEDEDDSCPDDPEDIDGFEDDDGCPDADVDVDPAIVDVDDDGEGIIDHSSDTIIDVEDRCPDEPEDRDGYEDIDSCPEPAAKIDQP